MTSEMIVLIMLCSLFLLTNLFWLVTVNKLINKIMSRSYGEFVQSENLKRPRVIHTQGEDPVQAVVENNRVQGLNQMMGMI